MSSSEHDCGLHHVKGPLSPDRVKQGALEGSICSSVRALGPLASIVWLILGERSELMGFA